MKNLFLVVISITISIGVCLWLKYFSENDKNIQKKLKEIIRDFKSETFFELDSSFHNKINFKSLLSDKSTKNQLH